jgi:hypothetical protein
VIRLRVFLRKGILRNPVVVEQLVDLHRFSLRLCTRAAGCGLADHRSGCKNGVSKAGGIDRSTDFQSVRAQDDPLNTRTD